MKSLLQRTKFWSRIVVFYFERRLVRYIIRPLLPIKRNKIVFDNFCGRGLGDSPMYIAKEIIRQGLNYDLVWLIKDMNEEMPEGIRKAKYRSFHALLEIATARIWVATHTLGIGENKRKGQYYIQTWHGGGVLFKYIQRAAIGLVSDYEIKLYKKGSLQIDLIISDNKLVTQDYKENFWLTDSCEILECGMPCKDGLYRSKDEITTIKKAIIGNRNVRIALYAPTFRDDNSLDGYNCDLESVRKKLEEKTSQNWVVIVRMHPNAVKYANIFTFNDNIINGSDISNPMDMTVISDLLITDYSSMSSDFLYLNKPVFILALDLEHYVTKCRKLHKYFYSLPYPYCETNEELLKAIEEFNYESYLNKIKDYKENFLKPFGNGHASVCVVERIKKVIEEK